MPVDVTADLPDRAKLVLEFWFGPGCGTFPDNYFENNEYSKRWYAGGESLDSEIRCRFADDIDNIAAGKYEDWREHAYSALAGIIIMDQFSRNMHRNTARMYALDEKCLKWANELIDTGKYDRLRPFDKIFAVMPFMHSEDLQDQLKCIDLFSKEADRVSQLPGYEAIAKQLTINVDFAKRHAAVVEQYGRFPHRNALLGRQNTAEEQAAFDAGTMPRF